MNLSNVDLAGIGAILAPIALFFTWLLSRRERKVSSDTTAMTATAEAAATSINMMQSLLQPMEDEIRQLRDEIIQARLEITVLRTHITLLETQVKELGEQPLPPPTFGDKLS